MLEAFQERLHESLDHQFAHSRRKSLFFRYPSGRLTVGPCQQLTELLAGEKELLVGLLADQTRQLTRDLAKRAAASFTEANQYISITKRQLRDLEAIYQRLFTDLLDSGESDQDSVLRRHYLRLQQFLVRTNGSAMFEPYRQGPDVPELPCAEYTAAFQLQLLGIDLESIQAPVLDIGCGPSATLVHHLRQNGIQAFGIERSPSDSPYVLAGDWFDLQLAENSWGTVISHMAFSNHFWHHHVTPDGRPEAYARKYMEILSSLKVGGRFIYAPGLPPMEHALEQTRSYRVTRRPLPKPGEGRFYVAEITRLS